MKLKMSQCRLETVMTDLTFWLMIAVLVLMLIVLTLVAMDEYDHSKWSKRIKNDRVMFKLKMMKEYK